MVIEGGVRGIGSQVNIRDTKRVDGGTAGLE